MNKNAERINNLFEELVPGSGKADSLAGEMVRATARIGYRFYNDGDQLGIGYGKETCNAAGRFLMEKGSETIGEMVAALWGTANEKAYETLLDLLCEEVADYIEANPALRTTPTEDMFSFYDKYEDVDDLEDEDDW